MPAKPVSALTRINKQLAAQGREERLVRGRGYYYLHGATTLPASIIYVYQQLTPEDYEFAAREVRDLFEAGGINVTFEGVK